MSILPPTVPSKPCNEHPMPFVANSESTLNMNDTSTQDPAALEREIRSTQDNMSATIDKIGNQLSIKNMFNALLDKADESNVDARMILDGARRNPVALGLIAAGAIWLISDKDSKIPSLHLKSDDGSNKSSAKPKYSNDYVSHMSAVEQRADEDFATYQRRRDIARSNYFMVERGHEEDDSSFRQRLDTMTESLRNKRHAIADKSGEFYEMAQDKAYLASDKTKDAFANSPLVGGMLAAALGAAIGSALPATRMEKKNLGKIGEQVRDTVNSKSEEASLMFREKKDELLEKADDALKPDDKGALDNTGVNSTSELADRRTNELV